MVPALTLPGLPEAPPRCERFFLALLPDARAIQQIAACQAALCNELGLRGRPLPPARLHVSLLGLGDFAAVPVQRLTAVRQLLAQLRLPPFVLQFDKLLSFYGRARAPTRRAVVLCGGAGVAGVVQLQHALAALLEPYGLCGHLPRRPTPHLTLLYDYQCMPERAIAPIRWTVSDFVLIHSQLGQLAPYRVLGRWPLQS
jgi:2'-5' RNA ligase